MQKFLRFIDNSYNNVFCERNVRFTERFATLIAITAFITHLALVFLNRQIDGPAWLESLDTSYLSTLFTPFAIILLYEVFLLIYALPKSITSSIVKQYEVISLIILWQVFKDASQLETISNVNGQSEIITALVADAGVSIILFGLVALFYYTIRHEVREKTLCGSKYNGDVYVAIKKLIAYVLMGLFMGLLISYLGSWVIGLTTGNYRDLFDVQSGFLTDLFTLMIFGDVVIVLLSYLFMESYSVIFRNALFIVSTVFIRFALTADRPLDLILSVVALVLGNLASLVYNQIGKYAPAREFGDALE